MLGVIFMKHKSYAVLGFVFLFALGLVGFGYSCGDKDYREALQSDTGFSESLQVLNVTEIHEHEEVYSDVWGGSSDDVDSANINADGVNTDEVDVNGSSGSKDEVYDVGQSIHQVDQLLHEDDELHFDEYPWNDDGGRGISGRGLDYVAPNNPLVDKTILGFAPYWGLDGYYQNYQMDKLSVVAYFAVACFPDGSLVKVCVDGNCGDKSGWDGWNSTALAGLVNDAHASGVKVVLVIKNFHKPSIETIISDQAAINRLISSIILEIEAKNVDGVNIDFEYIGTASGTHRARFASFIDQVADAVHFARPGSHVSVDIMATSGISTLIYDVTALGQTSVDHIMVMSYDFFSTHSVYAGPESPLYGNQYWYTVSRSMNDIAAKAPNHKVLMGIPYYGLEFPVTSGTWSAKNGVRNTSYTAGITTYKAVVDPIYDPWHNSSTIQWDEGEKMRWYKYRWPDPATGSQYWQGYYDDPRSLGAKYDFVRDNNLGGIGIWALGYDNGRDELWNTIRDKFSKGQFIVVFKNGINRTQQQVVHDALGGEVVRFMADESSVIVEPKTKITYDLILDYRRRGEVAGADVEQQRELF